MKLTEKIKSINVKVNPPRYTKSELERGINAGLEPRYHIRLSGQSPRDDAATKRRYDKNWQRGAGLCKGCKHFNPKIKKVGGHCRLEEQDNCIR